MADEETLTRSEFARRMSWSPSYITKLADAGRLVFTADGKQVMVEESLARIAATEDPARADVAARNAARRGKDAEPDGAEIPAPDPQAERIASSFQASRAVRERYAALTARMEYEKLAGNLVEASAVRAASADAASIIRGMLENLPAQLAPELAAEHDETRIQALLVEHIENLLNQIGDRILASAGRPAA